jgi:hypothetical protein
MVKIFRNGAIYRGDIVLTLIAFVTIVIFVVVISGRCRFVCFSSLTYSGLWC